MASNVKAISGQTFDYIKYVKQLQEDKEELWELETVPQKQLNVRKLMFLRGRQIGGSSAVNYMALARGPAADYDDWARMVGDDGWSWRNILPLMKELEDFDPNYLPICSILLLPRQETTSGPLKIGFGDEMVPGIETYVEACLENGIPINIDTVKESNLNSMKHIKILHLLI
ncbi:glucose-methanol-choline oxidoreductase [Penicillium malachiteum]|nr:glucose-methanol-choline oxidoreductase [Penicillium malachiteum]